MPSQTPRLDPTDLLGLGADLTDEEQMVQQTVRSFVEDKVLLEIDEWFERGEFPLALVKELGQIGLFGMHLDGYGAAGLGPVSYGLACLELEAGDSGLRSFVSVQGSLAMFPIWKYGSDEQKQQWLPSMVTGETIGCFGLTEPDSGSDPASMRTRARRDGSDWILDGTKMWITNGGIAEIAVVWAQTDEGIRGFLIPRATPGFTTNDVHRKLSSAASITSELVLEGCRLPGDSVLPGVSGLHGPLSCLSEARFGIIWGAMGAARTCFQTALSYAKEREQFGKPIAGFQITQAKLADMAVELEKGLLLALHLGRVKEKGLLSYEQVSIGKLNNVREAIAIARLSRTILGANGITLEYPIMRHANNLESVLTYEGTAEIHQLTIGRALTGLDAFS